MPYRAVLEADNEVRRLARQARLTSQLNEFERNMHSRYRLQWRNGNISFSRAQPLLVSFRALMCHIVIHQERLRLHRPFLVRGQGYERSRAACVEASSRLLAIHRCPLMRAACFGGLTYKAISAATCLTIDLLQSAKSSVAASTVQRDEVMLALDLLDQHGAVSGVARKGARLLRFLLEKERLMEETRLDRSQAKRQRLQTDPRSQLARALVVPGLPYFAPAPVEDDPLPHKRQSSTASSITLATPTEATFAYEPPPLLPTPGPRLQMPRAPPADMPPPQQPFHSAPTFDFEVRYDYGAPASYPPYQMPPMMNRGWLPAPHEYNADQGDSRYAPGPVWQLGPWPPM